MLKGAIDHVKAGEIGGWIYSQSESLRSRTVLAFLNDVCIGGGPVEMYRADLEEAGLGDGYVGFKFPVTLSSPADFPVVVVKLEGSDAVLLQRSAKLIDRASIPARTSLTIRTAASIEWMRGRGWLDQREYDFLRLMQRFGVYDMNLRDAKTEDNASGLRAPQEAAKSMFDLLCTEESEVSTEGFGPDLQIADLIDKFRRGTIEPIISLWSAQPGVVSVVEGSNQDADPAAAKGNVDGAVDYRIGPDRLLFLDLRCRIKAELSNHVRSYVIAVG